MQRQKVAELTRKLLAFGHKLKFIDQREISDYKSKVNGCGNVQFCKECNVGSVEVCGNGFCTVLCTLSRVVSREHQHGQKRSHILIVLPEFLTWPLLLNGKVLGWLALVCVWVNVRRSGESLSSSSDAVMSAVKVWVFWRKTLMLQTQTVCSRKDPKRSNPPSGETGRAWRCDFVPVKMLILVWDCQFQMRIV